MHYLYIFEVNPLSVVAFAIIFSHSEDFLIAHLIKNLPAMQETLVQFLGQEENSGERIGYPLQYSWAFLVVQLVKNLPAVRESWVQSLIWEDLLEKGKAIHFSILA